MKFGGPSAPREFSCPEFRGRWLPHEFQRPKLRGQRWPPEFARKKFEGLWLPLEFLLARFRGQWLPSEFHAQNFRGRLRPSEFGSVPRRRTGVRSHRGRDGGGNRKSRPPGAPLARRSVRLRSFRTGGDRHPRQGAAAMKGPGGRRSTGRCAPTRQTWLQSVPVASRAAAGATASSLVQSSSAQRRADSGTSAPIKKAEG